LDKASCHERDSCLNCLDYRYWLYKGGVQRNWFLLSNRLFKLKLTNKTVAIVINDVIFTFEAEVIAVLV